MTLHLRGEPEPHGAHRVIGSDWKSSIAGHRTGSLKERRDAAAQTREPGGDGVALSLVVNHRTQRRR
jgi:hypothetical protein